VCRIYLYFVLTLHGVCVCIVNSVEQSVTEHIISMATISKFHMNCKQISIERVVDFINNMDATSGIATFVGSWSQMFWDSLLVPSSNVKQWLFWASWPLRTELIGCHETLVINYKLMPLHTGRAKASSVWQQKPEI